MTIFPLPTGTRQMVLQFLQVKYLWALSAWRALAFWRLLFIRHIQFTHRWFSLRRLVRFREKMRNRAKAQAAMDTRYSASPSHR